MTSYSHTQLRDGRAVKINAPHLPLLCSPLATSYMKNTGEHQQILVIGKRSTEGYQDPYMTHAGTLRELKAFAAICVFFQPHEE